MSATVDVNVLVHASNEDSNRHVACRDLLARLSAGPGLVYLLWPAVIGYLRVSTLPAISTRPLTPARAEANVSALLAHPNVRTVAGAEHFWRTYQTVTAEVRPRGNLVSDAYLVALMHQHGISTMWSYDTDFRKFSGITVREP